MKKTFTNTTTGNTEQATKENLINAIIDYFEENEEAFNKCIEELDSYNGYLGDDRYYEMEMLSEFYSDPLELLEHAYYGWDEDNYTYDSCGEKRHAEFCPNRDYFRYNGYGNLISTDYIDYSDHLDHYAVEEMLEHKDDIFYIEEDSTLCELFKMLNDVELSEITE